MIRFTFKLYIQGLIIAILKDEIKQYIDFAIKKICPVCKHKMVKNDLNFYNCPECFRKYFGEDIII